MCLENIIIYKGHLFFDSEFHSTALADGGVTDHPLVRDTQGRFILRGESLAGIIRKELVRCFGYKCLDYKDPGGGGSCNCSVCSLMGQSRVAESDKRRGKEEYRDSRLQIRGGVITQGEARIRHGVAIDRTFQVAAEHKKYDKETLSKGALVPFKLELANPDEIEVQALEKILCELQNGLISIGGKKGTGLGRCSVSELKRLDYDLSEKQGVKDYLLRKEPEENSFKVATACESQTFVNYLRDKEKNTEKNYQGVRFCLAFDLWFPELFMVNDPLEAALLGSDHVSVADERGNPWLPGSTLRGIFRTRCEQILRTFNGLSACDPSCDEKGHPLQSCSSIIEKRRKDDRPSDRFDREKMDKIICPACSLFGCTFQAGRIKFQTGVYKGDKSHIEGLQHFLAIDRFTGGGKDGAKFDAWTLYNVDFSGCRLIAEDFEKWQIGLLALTFKDLLQADLHMGYGTRKGFGRVVGSLNSGLDMFFSSPGILVSFKPDDLSDKNTGKDFNVREFLESSVEAFREKMQHYNREKNSL